MQASTYKMPTKEQKSGIYKKIDRLDKSNIYTYQQIIMKAANCFICFQNCVIDHK